MDKQDIIKIIYKQIEVHENLIAPIDRYNDQTSWHGHSMAIKTLNLLIERIELEYKLNHWEQK